MTLAFQRCIDVFGCSVTPVGQQHDVITLVAKRLRLERVDNQRAQHAGLLLVTRMTVIPVGAALQDGKAILEGLARADAGKTEIRHTVHIGRQNNAVPVDGSIDRKIIGNPQRDVGTFLPAQGRRRQAAIHDRRESRRTGEIDFTVTDTEVEAVTANDCRAGCRRTRRLRPARLPVNATEQAGCGESGYESTARQCRLMRCSQRARARWKFISL